MRKLEHYISAGGKRLRCGYTTGTCAAAAARAAAELLLAGTRPAGARIETPAGVDVFVEAEALAAGDGWAECAVRKDAGDDPDITDGALVYVRVSLRDEPGVSIDGGEGVGRVTRAGLDQPVGAAAINSVPRAMIREQLEAAAQAADYVGGLAALVSIPAGADLAARTFNPRLGIEGGISVLGTSGIVKPMSEDALIASLQVEMDVLHAAGVRDLLLVPGNYGRDFARDELRLDVERGVQCSNYLGAALDHALQAGFGSVLVVGHIGKLAKVAAGAMNTHSRVADARAEALGAYAACAGAGAACVQAVLEAPTTDAMLDLLEAEGVLQQALQQLVERVAFQLEHRVHGELRTEAVVFSKPRGLLGMTAGARELVERVRASGRRAAGMCSAAGRSSEGEGA